MRSHSIANVVVAAVLLISAAALVLAQPAAADEFSRLYSQILRNPQSVSLNMRYAKLAEERDENRKALAAYERVLDVDPNNTEARSGLNRITADLTPAITRGRLELGVRYESNVREAPAGGRDDVMGFAKLYVSDERGLLQHIWRSDIDVYADVHGETSALDFWRAKAHTGPVFNLGGGTTLHVAPGGGISFLDADYFYSEASLRLVFEQLFGFLDRLEVSGGYRDIDNSFSRDSGVVMDIVARESFRAVLSDSDAIVLQPFFRWRDASGNGANAAGLPTSFLMGDYIEAGARFMYYLYLDHEIRLGGRFTYWYRDYTQNIAAGTFGREDWYIAPEAEVMFRNAVCSGCDIRLRYRYEQNFSNDATQDYDNHSIIASGIRRF